MLEKGAIFAEFIVTKLERETSNTKSGNIISY